MMLRYAIYSVNASLQNKLDGVIDLTNTKPDLYSSYPKNEHHWTTKWVWDNFIPRITSDLRIPFNPTDFTEISCIYDGHDLSYHIPVHDNLIDIHDLYTNTQHRMYIKDTFFNKNFSSPFGASTGYHKLFIFSHRCCNIHNERSRTSRSLILNTDSMSVPVIGNLIPYFKDILILDNRTNKSYKPIITEFTNTNRKTLSYVELFIAESYNFHKYALNLK